MNTESDGVNPRLRTWGRRFMPVAGNIAEVRQGARIVLAGWAVPDDACETVVLIVSELATNAVRHARLPDRTFDVALTYDDGGKAVEVEVSDGSPHHPVVRPFDPDETSGRGLLLVEALSDAWEVRDREFGKTVWVRVLG
ncbi:ATP-binding protein [Streptomyces sp. NPDC005808]|uniref:ATP-binding protein n=1 Tax=Streptomyces sp. NPDC005808 TaxID=3364734 RepID=UPI0036B53D25